MTRLKFLTDEDVRRPIVLGIRQREPAVDILTAREGRILGISDPKVLGRGSLMGRVVVSSDQSTMPGHFWRFIEANDSPGMIILPQSVDVSRAVEELLHIWTESRVESLHNQIRWVKAWN